MGLLRRTVVKWTLSVIGVIAVAIVAFVVGRESATPSASYPVKRHDHGSRSAEVPLVVPIGITANIGGGRRWRLRVLHVTANADREVLAAERAADPLGPFTKVPPGAQDFLARVSLTYVGGGKANPTSWLNGFYVVGSHHASYYLTENSCGDFVPERLDNTRHTDVFSGQSVQGNICFQIAANDAKSLRLHPHYGSPPGEQPWRANMTGKLPKLANVWFALYPLHEHGRESQ